MNDLVLFEKDNLDKVVKAATMLAKSQVIPYTLKGKVEDVFTILIMGNELGLQPMSAINSIHVIKGKPTLSAQLMIALVRSKMKTALIDIKIDEVNKVATCETARDMAQKDFSYTATWDMSKAMAMGLGNSDQYKKQAMNMLKWRAVSESLRVTFPDVLMGIYATEEFRDFSGKELTVINEKESLDEDFPIPEEEKVSGPEYRFQNGKFRNKQMKDIDPTELETYHDALEGRIEKGVGKPWEHELYGVLANYLASLDAEPVQGEK